MRRNQPAKRGKDVDQVSYRSCIVSFTDILGFRSLIDEVSAQDIYSLLSQFRSVAGVEAKGIAPALVEMRSISPMAIFSISDAIVRVRQYKEGQLKEALFWELYELTLIQRELIKKNILIRSGVTVGEAYFELRGEGIVFGPALTRAYEIESKEAIFPRILLDPDLVDFEFEESAGYHGTQNSIREMLRVSEDGTLFINYMSDDVVGFGDLDFFLDFLHIHHQLLSSFKKRELSRSVRRKISWLEQYHNSSVLNLRRNLSTSHTKSGLRALSDLVSIRGDILKELDSILLKQ